MFSFAYISITAKSCGISTYGALMTLSFSFYFKLLHAFIKVLLSTSNISNRTFIEGIPQLTSFFLFSMVVIIIFYLYMLRTPRK